MVNETLSNLLSAAVDDERIPRNPAKGARLAKAESAPFVPLTADQVHAIAGHTVEHVRASVVVASGTGLCQGELFGSPSTRIDFMRREIRLDRHLWTPSKGRPVFKAPKSKNSYRIIALSTVVLDARAAHVASFGPGEDGLVFHIDWRPVSRCMASKYSRLAAAALASPDTPGIDLRHHHASVLLSAGVSPALVAERLGHDVKTLLTTYANVIRNDDDRCIPSSARRSAFRLRTG